MSLTKYAEFTVLAVESANGATLRDNGNPFVKQAHRHHFDYERRPGYIYVRSRAISSRTNDNHDNFPAAEIKKAYKTFIGKPVFVNHHNANHRRARGVMIDAALHEDINPDGTEDVWAEVLMEVDAIRFPRLAEAVVRGDIARTSMGTDVAYSICTACGNKAVTPADYCQHIPRLKGMKIRRVTASGAPEEILIAEACYGLSFFENSLLVEDPADPTAFVLGVEGDGVQVTASRTAKEAAKDPTVPPSEHGDPRLRDAGVSVSKDDKGYYVHTHRARSKSYDSVAKIPDSKITEIEATGSKSAANEGWEPQKVKGSDVQVGDRLDRSGKTRVSLTHPSDTHMRAQTTTTGTRSPSVQRWPLEEEVTVYRRRTSAATRLANFVKTADEDQCPFCAGDSLPINGTEYSCMDCNRIWDIRSPAAQAYHGDGPMRGQIQPTAGANDYQSVRDVKAGDKVFFNRGYGGRVPGTVTKADGKSVRVRGDHSGSEHDIDDNKLSGGHYQMSPYKKQDQARDKATVSEDRKRSEVKRQQRKPSPVQRAASRHLAYGEVKAPAQVDTLRADRCPVCQDDEAFNGEKCSVCGHVEPPSMFGDPDLTKAKEMDLRQEKADEVNADPLADPMADPAVDEAGDPALDPSLDTASEDLQCTNCGETFSAEGEPEASPDQAEGTEPEAADEQFQPEDPQAAEDDGDVDLDDLADKTDEELGLEDEVEEEGEPEEATPEPDPSEDLSEDSDPADPEGVDLDADGDADIVIEPNMVCPICGDGTLVAPGASQDQGAPSDNPLDDTQVAGDPDLQTRGSHRVASSTTSRRKTSRDMNQPNPSKKYRNLLLATVQEQQGRIEVLTAAVSDLVKAAGVQHHPRFASLIKQADEDNPDTTTEQAKQPMATDSPESPGAVPAQANTGVTPDATTDVQNSNVAIPDSGTLENLQDVTAPVSGTDAVDPSAVFDGEVRVTAPNTNVQDPSSGWTTTPGSTNRTSARGDDQSRFVESLRLARLQISAGLVSGEDLSVAQRIFEGKQTMGEISASASTLNQVQSARTASQPSERHRHLVPTSTGQRQNPSFQAQQGLGATASVSDRGDDEFMFGDGLD